MSFPNTRLSVVERTRRVDEETRRVAYAAIIEAYWPTYADIARELGMTAATVTNHLAAMRRQFRAIVLEVFSKRVRRS